MSEQELNQRRIGIPVMKIGDENIEEDSNDPTVREVAEDTGRGLREGDTGLGRSKT